MNLFSKEQLDDLIEQTYSIEVPESDEHRSTLRRKLLNSSYFDEHRNVMRRRATLFVPVVVSGFAVTVLFVGLHTAPALNLDTGAGQEEVASAINPDFLTDGLVATFVDDRPLVTTSLHPNTVTFSTAAMAMRVN